MAGPPKEPERVKAKKPNVKQQTTVQQWMYMKNVLGLGFLKRKSANVMCQGKSA